MSGSIPRVLVSACLIGINCRYSGDGCKGAPAQELARDFCLIPVCPEQLGGLPTPRAPHEILGSRVVDSEGNDGTQAFERGAREALRIAKLLGCEFALLKERSPSCGTTCVYDGTFSGKRIAGMGVTARLLASAGLKLFSEECIDDLKDALRVAYSGGD